MSALPAFVLAFGAGFPTPVEHESGESLPPVFPMPQPRQRDVEELLLMARRQIDLALEALAEVGREAGRRPTAAAIALLEESQEAE